MKKNLIAAVVTSALVSPIALADTPSYSYFEGGYAIYDESPLEAKGLYIAGSVEAGENFFLNFDYAPLEGELSGFSGDFDFDSKSFGFGYKSDINDTTNWFASYSIGSWGIESEDVDVNTIRVGLRSQLTENFELNGSIASHDLEFENQDNSETGFQVGMAYQMSETLQFTADYESIDDLDIMTFGLRMNF